MNISIKKRFSKDTEEIPDKKILYQNAGIMDAMKIEMRSEIEHCKNLKCSKHTFRIKLGQYGIGFVFEREVVEMVRVLHRKDIYNNFTK